MEGTTYRIMLGGLRLACVTGRQGKRGQSWRTVSSQCRCTAPILSRKLSDMAIATKAAAKNLESPQQQTFLKAEFLEQYEPSSSSFGFNGLGELVYKRTYSRKKPDGSNEEWRDTVQRVVEGTFNMQRRWSQELQLGFDYQKASIRAEKMFDKIFNMKFLPPGRGLWAMGSPLTEDPENRIYAALNNCAFVSTESMHNPLAKASKPFAFLMDATMIGVGVGFDVKGALATEGDSETGKGFFVPGPVSDPNDTLVYNVKDSREGWVDSVTALLDSYFEGGKEIEFQYSQIRPAGEPIKGMGGVTMGAEPLIKLHSDIRNTLEPLKGKPISITAIVDLMNLIGQCVVSVSTRRSAEISFGPPGNEEYANLKNYEINPERMEYGWASNNSVYCELGMDYEGMCDRIRTNGEPGFAWLSNMQQYSRMCDPADNKDKQASGGNPCLEQTLESFEVCCLVETFPDNHDSLEEFLDTLESAYLYAKTVTLGETHWPETNRVMLRNRRIGCSMSGLAQFITHRGIHELKGWSETGYQRIQELDEQFSNEFGIPRSIKTTSIKPSGTVSLLAGATSGIHYPEDRFIIRRVRIPSNSNELLDHLIACGYPVEQDVVNPSLSVVSFPLDYGEGIRAASDVPMWEQLSLAAFMQKYWADNQVSATVTFDPDVEGSQLANAVNYFQYQLKGVSMLPRLPQGSYAQMPLESITEEEFHRISANITPVSFASAGMEDYELDPDKYCDTDRCAAI